MNEDYDRAQAELDDAIIEDTCHCCVCGSSFVLGGNDYVLLDGADIHFRPECNGAFCIVCAEAVHKAFLAECFEGGVCEHGLCLSQPCDECLAPLNLCKDILKFFGSQEAWGDYATLGKAAVAFGPIADRARKILEGKPL